MTTYYDGRPGWSGHWTDGRRFEHGAFWEASGLLIPCAFCGADPFTPCHVRDFPATRAQLTHSGRSYDGQQVLKRALGAVGSRECTAAAETAPPVEPFSLDELRAIVETYVADALKKRATPKRATPIRPAKRRAS